MTDFSPREIVSELDRYIVGQSDAKRAVAIALRNRWRRKQLDRHHARGGDAEEHPDDRPDRRRQDRDLAAPGQACQRAVPQGRGDQVHRGRLCRPRRRPDRARSGRSRHRHDQARRKRKDVEAQAQLNAEEPRDRRAGRRQCLASPRARSSAASCAAANSTTRRSRSRWPTPAACRSFEIPGMPGGSGSVINLSDMLGKAFGGRTKTRRMTVKASHELLIAEEADKLLDQEQIVQEAIEAVENNGIVFLDEIDKICARSERAGRRCQPRRRAARPAAADRGHHGLDQARAGEDRPYPVHRLGRLPRRQALGPAARTAGPPADPRRAEGADRDDFGRILTEPEASLHQAVCGPAGHRRRHARLHRTTPSPPSRRSPPMTNASIENIGARRLQTVMERVLDEISFAATDRSGETVTDRRRLCREAGRRSGPQRRSFEIHPLTDDFARLRSTSAMMSSSVA